MGILDTFKKKKKSGAPTPKEEVVPVTAPKPLQSIESSNLSHIILSPIVSEKAAHAESERTYSFFVRLDATKSQVGQAIREMYKVKPIAIRTSNTQGKWRRFGRKIGRTSDRKKAMITLAEGQSIRIHEGV